MELEVLPTTALSLNLTAAQLISKGVSFLEEELQKLKEAEGGVVFVDEAYQLAQDRMGKQVLDFILPLAEGLETDYGRLVWVFAGYVKDMEELFTHNQGLPSRFPLQYHFEDYSDAELLHMFKSHLKYTSAPKEKKDKKKNEDEKKGPATQPPSILNQRLSPPGSFYTYERQYT